MSTSENTNLPNQAVISDEKIITLKFLPYGEIERETPYGGMTVVAGVDASWDPRGANLCLSLAQAANIVGELIELCKNNPSYVGPIKTQAPNAIVFLNNCAKNEQIRVNAIKALMGTIESYDTPSST